MDVELRQPSLADAERLGRMHYASCHDAYSSFLPSEFWGEATEQRWIGSWVKDLQSPQPESVTWIALRDGEILGFATVGPTRQNPTRKPFVLDWVKRRAARDLTGRDA